ncbi:hypothetical protein BTA51_27690 [Hahella sp. CCB-MM4]|nr:hypothetical protein BTA51_27690 [Hahella sp. CCB-MM4]
MMFLDVEDIYCAQKGNSSIGQKHGDGGQDLCFRINQTLCLHIYEVRIYMSVECLSGMRCKQGGSTFDREMMLAGALILDRKLILDRTLILDKY